MASEPCCHAAPYCEHMRKYYERWPENRPCPRCGVIAKVHGTACESMTNVIRRGIRDATEA